MNLSKNEYIAIVDYKCGNINSIYRILRSLKKNVEISDKLEILKYSKLIILPGVGHYKRAIDILKKKNLYNFLKKTKIPIFGICLGMQILSEIGYEGGKTKGLNKIDGKVIKNKKNFNIGWLPVFYKKTNKLNFLKKYNNKYFYFNHGFKYLTKDKNVIITSYIDREKINSLIYQKNVIGVQFHPEKSQIIGKEFLRDILAFFKI